MNVENVKRDGAEYFSSVFQFQENERRNLMAKEEDREQLNIYNIPANYNDSGRLFGGMVQTRNLVEVIVLVGIIGYLELKIPVNFTIKSSIMVVTLAPIFVFGLMGVDGGSLTQFLFTILKFLRNRRKLRMRRVGYKYDPREIGEKPSKERLKAEKQARFQSKKREKAIQKIKRIEEKRSRKVRH